MPGLIHLNGPSGIGKSTTAQHYVDRHPGVLNLDIDRVVALIGGWRDDFWRTCGAGRPRSCCGPTERIRTRPTPP
ncbi:MAG TPA: hypothetical protein VHV49_11615 [Pseudonocardiaceae bacterium]|nr:hypothetical protein [Pseudonocardiaceae bacterium]